MSNPNINLSNLDARYSKPTDVAAAISAQATTDAGKYATQANLATKAPKNLIYGTRRDAGRFAPPLTLTTTSPAISYPLDTGQAIITNYKTISLNPATAPVSFLGAAGFTLSGSSYAPNSVSLALGVANDDASHPNPRAPGNPSLLFGFDGAVLVAQIFNKGPGYYRVRVDDQYVGSTTPVTVASDGSWHLLTIDFTNEGGARPRKIRIDLNNHELISLRVGPTDTVWSLPAKGPRVIVLGDSYTGGAGPGGSGGLSTWPAYMADDLGWEDYWNSGIGGTGYVATNNAIYGGGPKFRDRLTTDIFPYNPDILVVAGGHNDTAGTALQTEASTFFSAARAGLPDTRIVVVGPLVSGATVSGYTAVQASLTTAIAACPVGTIDQFIDTISVAWLTGTGYSTNLKNDGNSDVYIGSDSVHPTELGHAYLGRRVAQAIQSGLSG